MVLSGCVALMTVSKREVMYRPRSECRCAIVRVRCVVSVCLRVCVSVTVVLCDVRVCDAYVCVKHVREIGP